MQKATLTGLIIPCAKAAYEILCFTTYGREITFGRIIPTEEKGNVLDI